MPAVQPMRINQPNIAGGYQRGLNMASGMDARNVAKTLTRVKFGLSLLSGVTDQDSLDDAKTKYLSLIPTGERQQAQQNVEQMFGAKYDEKRIKGARTQLISLSDQLASYARPMSVAAGAGIYDPLEGEIVASQPAKPRGPLVTINTGDLTKPSQTKLEKDIMEGLRNVNSFRETGKLFKPEYLTYWGKGEKFIATAADKAGISTAGQKGLIKERAAWFRQAKADFIAYRKWATGVAGGEKEMAEIATSFPDPVKNSPTEYQANLTSIEETTKRVLQLNAEFLSSGIDVRQPIEKIFDDIQRLGIDIGESPSPGGVTRPVIPPPGPDTLTPQQEADAFLKKAGY